MRGLRAPAIALLLMLVLMPVLFFALPGKAYSPTERRYLARPPEVTWEKLVHGELGENFEEYLADHFPGRNLFVGIHAYWDLLTGRNTAGTVYHCRDGYLISAPKACTADQMEKNLSRFDRFAEEQGLPATLFLIPSAADVLTELLPAHHAPCRYEECFALAQQCPHLAVPNLKEALLAEGGRQFYYRTDHHLTSAGCCAVYEAFCRAQGRVPFPREDYQVTAYEGFRGSAWSSSGYWLTPAERVETWGTGAPLRVTIEEPGKEPVVEDRVFFLENLESDDLYTVFLDGNHALVRIENPAADGGRLLLLRDSYAHCLAPFLASDYEEVVLVDLRYYRLSVSELVREYGITELGMVYGVDNLLTDSNSAWLS